MIDEHFEGRSGSRHYSRWPDPWRREDDWGPITAAVMFFVILARLIHRTRRSRCVGQESWRRSSLASFDIGLRFRPLNFLDSDQGGLEFS